MKFAIVFVLACAPFLAATLDTVEGGYFRGSDFADQEALQSPAAIFEQFGKSNATTEDEVYNWLKAQGNVSPYKFFADFKDDPNGACPPAQTVEGMKFFIVKSDAKQQESPLYKFVRSYGGRKFQRCAYELLEELRTSPEYILENVMDQFLAAGFGLREDAGDEQLLEVAETFIIENLGTNQEFDPVRASQITTGHAILANEALTADLKQVGRVYYNTDPVTTVDPEWLDAQRAFDEEQDRDSFAPGQAMIDFFETMLDGFDRGISPLLRLTTETAAIADKLDGFNFQTFGDRVNKLAEYHRMMEEYSQWMEDANRAIREFFGEV